MNELHNLGDLTVLTSMICVRNVSEMRTESKSGKVLQVYLTLCVLCEKNVIPKLDEKVI